MSAWLPGYPTASSRSTSAAASPWGHRGRSLRVRRCKPLTLGRKNSVAWSYLLQMAISGVAVGALYGVVAMCFVLIHKTSRVINFAQGESVLVGAWICWWLLAVCRLPFLLGFLATLLLMLAFGALVHALVLRPMLGKPAISAVMATIGLSTFLQALMKGTFGVFVQPFPNVLLGTSVSVLGVEIRTVYLFSLL